MSLSATAAAFDPTATAATLPANQQPHFNTLQHTSHQHQPNTARESNQCGRGGGGGSRGGGGGRGRGGGGGRGGGISATGIENLSADDYTGTGGRGGHKNQPHHIPHHQQHNNHCQRGGRGGGGGGRGGRGGGRGGHHQSSNHQHQQQQQHRGSGSVPAGDAAMSPEDAAAIEAALLDHPHPSSASTNPPATSSHLSRSTSASSSSNSTNLTRELLGFRYEPTTLQRDRYLNRPKQNPRGKTAPTFNKHVYMQANHHFLLGSDDPASFLLPDHQVDWTKVELVVCPVDNAERDCPICLSPPTVAKITRCGHVFCFSCILHYLSLSDRSWSRCPLCFDAVYPQALKSVEFRVHRKFHEGDSIEFVLMRRFKDCVNAVPDEGNPNDFSRIRLITDISNILQREFTELFNQRESYVEAGTSDDLALGYLDNCESQMVARMNEWSHAHPHWVMKSPTYEQMKQQQVEKFERIKQDKQKAVERAKSILGKAEAWPELPASKPSKPTQSTTTAPTATANAASSSSSSSSTSHPAAAPASVSTAVTSSPPAVASSTSSSAKSSSFFDEGEEAAEYKFNKMKIEREKQQQAAAAVASPITPTPANPTSSPSAPSDVYYFYQSSDGQQLYLHSLAYRSLLLNCNNDLSKLPIRIQGKASYLDAYVIDANIRAKFRFLSHLPLTATFQLGLVDIHQYVSKETMQQMKPEYEADKKQRQTAARKQKELNKRSIQSSKALAASNAASGAGPNALSAAAYRNWQLEQDVQSFPDLPANPLGLASAAATTTSSLTPTTRSPDLKPSVVNWKTVAEKGLASSELWAPLGGTTAAAPAPHWGASAAPLASGSATAPWGRSISQSSSASDKAAETEPEFPTPTVNRNGLTTLLSTGSKRSYR